MVLRRPTRLLVTLGVVAMLLVVGGIAAASLLSRKNEVPAAPYDEPVSAPAHDSWQVVTDSAAKLAFEVPPDWELAADDESLTTSNGVKLGHLADWGRYSCQGAEYGRAFAASGVAQPDRKPGKAAGELAAAVAADQYSDGHRTASVKVEKPQPLSVDGAQGALVRAEATLPEGDEPDECTGSKGTVTVVALATSAGNSVLVIAADSVPGPDEPTPLADPARLDAIVKSLRVAP